MIRRTAAARAALAAAALLAAALPVSAGNPLGSGGPLPARHVSPFEHGGLERACGLTAARLAEAPPNSVYIQGRVAGPNAPQVQLWAGGGQWICRPAGDGKLAFFRVRPY